MDGKRPKKKKPTIFKIFLIPLIFIMLVQSIITIGTLVIRRTAGTLAEYSSSMMSRLVENRKVILQNDMTQRWAPVHEQEEPMSRILGQLLQKNDMELWELLESDGLRSELLELLFPECLEVLQGQFTTGTFLILTDRDWQEAGEFEGFFIRDSDPDTNPANATDLLLERGNKQLSRKWNIPLDTCWTTRFRMDGQGKNAADSFFYEPWRAGREYASADIVNLGYWSMPFYLEKETEDSYEMITYSLPLRYEGEVYGVLGVEISSRDLQDYFPVTELNDNQQSGYMLALRDSDGSFRPLVGKGLLYNLVRSGADRFSMSGTGYGGLSLVEGIRLGKQDIYAVVCPLRLYGNNVPYEDTDWVLLGLDTEENLFGMSRHLYLWIVAAILVGLLFGVFGIYILVRYLTRPVQRLMECISRGREGLLEFRSSNILEIDGLYDVVRNLTERQREAEDILLEEKERYRVALESSKDIYFSYDLQNNVLDIVNHKTMSGQWQCRDNGGCFIDPENIYDMDREDAIRALQARDDKIYAEFRLKWPEEAGFRWVAVSGKMVLDMDGRQRKLVGSIRNIQEQKEKEAEQRRRNTTDGVTGLYTFSAGMERLGECRSGPGGACDEAGHDGVMIDLALERLKEINEKNGIVFGDMILEEIGILIRSAFRRMDTEADQHAVAFRLDGDEFGIWLGGCGREQATEFIEKLLEAIAASFDRALFGVDVRVGLVCGHISQVSETLICMAVLARTAVVSDAAGAYLFYEDLSGKEKRSLPPLRGREINSLDYGEDVNLVSVALNLFGKGADFPAQMTLLLRKAGRFYGASDVLVSVLRNDFSSNYLEYQWHESGEAFPENVRKYGEELWEAFSHWLGQKEVRYFSEEDSAQEMLQCFLSIGPEAKGIVLPMYDNGRYMGNICMLGVERNLLEDGELYQDLAEFGRVVQSQMNQQQHDIASKAKSEFLSRMSHEIRTPMNGIIGMTEIALQQDQSRERILDCLQKIQTSSGYLLGLINDILDMSKIESGKMRLTPGNFDMREMLGTIRELIMPQVSAKRIDLIQDISLLHHWFVADRMRISQVLINLLGNAVKFTPEEGRIIWTVREESATQTGAVVFFAVRDTGIGIGKEDQERVFRSFEQAYGANPSKQQGTGLGLSISSRLIQMMGSNIRLESEKGEGSTFSFSIPLEFGEGEQKAAQEAAVSFEGCHILVVEDNEINAEIAQCLLEERGFVVDCVYDGAQAVERIRTTPSGTYDVILMDIMMPVMNGLDATRAIRAMEREDCHTIPIVAMSANAFDDDLKKSVECGMNGHLSKPVEVDKLYKMLDLVVHGEDGTFYRV